MPRQSHPNPASCPTLNVIQHGVSSDLDPISSDTKSADDTTTSSPTRYDLNPDIAKRRLMEHPVFNQNSIAEDLKAYLPEREPKRPKSTKRLNFETELSSDEESEDKSVDELQKQIDELQAQFNSLTLNPKKQLQELCQERAALRSYIEASKTGPNLLNHLLSPALSMLTPSPQHIAKTQSEIKTLTREIKKLKRKLPEKPKKRGSFKIYQDLKPRRSFVLPPPRPLPGTRDTHSPETSPYRSPNPGRR